MDKDLKQKMLKSFLEYVLFDGPQELWCLISMARYILNNDTNVHPEQDASTSKTRQDLVLGFIQELLDEDYIKVNFFVPPNQMDLGDDLYIDSVSAKGTSEEIVAQLKRKWDDLKREPNFMEVAEIYLTNHLFPQPEDFYFNRQ